MEITASLPLPLHPFPVQQQVPCCQLSGTGTGIIYLQQGRSGVKPAVLFHAQIPRIRAAFRMQTWVLASEIFPSITSLTRSFRGMV